MAAPTPESVGLPRHNFLYTMDQVSGMLNVPIARMGTHYIHYQGRSAGVPTADRFRAINIAPTGAKPDWRVEERELIRWLRRKGFKAYDS